MEKVDFKIDLATSTRLFDIMPGGSEVIKSCLIDNQSLIGQTRVHWDNAN